METEKRKRRICEFCGLLTDDEYTDEEWEAMGYECDDCMDAELIEEPLMNSAPSLECRER